MNESNLTNKEELIELITLRTQVAILKRMTSAESTKIIYAKDVNQIFGWEHETTGL